MPPLGTDLIHGPAALACCVHHSAFTPDRRKRPETHFTLPHAPRPSQLNIELPFGWENLEHDEIRG
jgi:hypothetical protein